MQIMGFKLLGKKNLIRLTYVCRAAQDQQYHRQTGCQLQQLQGRPPCIFVQMSKSVISASSKSYITLLHYEAWVIGAYERMLICINYYRSIKHLISFRKGQLFSPDQKHPSCRNMTLFKAKIQTALLINENTVVTFQFTPHSYKKHMVKKQKKKGSTQV